MRPTVYIETTVPSYYCDERTAHVNEINRTREWWDTERDTYECFISPVVLEELQGGDYPNKQKCLELVGDLPVLLLHPDIRDIARAYRQRALMPLDPAADSVHLAIASYYQMEYLLTWNCKHLANANKVRHLETLNNRLGLSVPILTTPHMLQPWEQRP